MYNADVADIDKLAEKLPRPCGYKILVATAKMEEKKGSVFIPEQYRNLEDTASIIGYVIAMGPDAYTDKKKFPSGPFCKVNDWVMYRQYSGTRFKVSGTELRHLNDDQVEAVVDDPRLIERA